MTEIADPVELTRSIRDIRNFRLVKWPKRVVPQFSDVMKLAIAEWLTDTAIAPTKEIDDNFH